MPTSAAQSSLRVLLVDDDPSALILIHRYLTDAGHSVVQAAGGDEALRILLSEGPQIVITDWSMPKMDGLELCRAIRGHEGIPFAYVIVLTAHDGSSEQITQAFDAGADDYLCKPINRRELLARLHAGERIVSLHQTLERRHRELHRVNAEMAIAYSQLGEANEKLNRLVMTDELTGLINRREAMVRLSAYWAGAQRRGTPLACILLDIDRFKHCNDAYGHGVGDVVLKEVARILRASARREESVCRVGGEEFLILCPHATQVEAAVGAERIRRAIEANLVRVHGLDLRMTISLGVAERTPHMQNHDDLLREADHALYAAKRSGRNAVRLAGQIATGPILPEPTPEGGPLAALDPSPQGASASNGEVLIVDDDPLFRSICRTALQTAGYSVVEAENGMVALDQLEQGLPDVVLMDTLMPELDGLECTRRIKKGIGTQCVPVIIAGPRNHSDDIIAALEAGADEYMIKPLDLHELVRRVRTMIRLSRELVRSNEVRGEQSRALGILSDFSRTVSRCTSLDALLERILVAAAELTCSQRLCIFLPDPAQTHLTVARSIGLSDKAEFSVRVPIGAPTVGVVFGDGRSLLLATREDLQQCSDGADACLLSRLPCVVTALSAPEHAVGVLVVTGRANDRPFNAVELEYVDLICNIGAAAIADYLSRLARDEAHDSIVVGLAKLAEHRDVETGRHLDRVTRFAVFLAHELRKVERFHRIISDEFIADLERAVPLHDIGKVAVPDRILHKPARLTSEEMSIMKTHASVGARTIRSLVDRVPGIRFLSMAEQIAFGHHERYDGGGYPAGIRGEAIPLPARIVAVADVYDAVTTKRVYQDAISHERALALIAEGAGTQFDPVVVDAFVKCEADFARLAREFADQPPRRQVVTADTLLGANRSQPASVPTQR